MVVLRFRCDTQYRCHCMACDMFASEMLLPWVLIALILALATFARFFTTMYHCCNAALRAYNQSTLDLSYVRLLDNKNKINPRLLAPAAASALLSGSSYAPRAVGPDPPSAAPLRRVVRSRDPRIDIGHQISRLSGVVTRLTLRSAFVFTNTNPRHRGSPTR